MAAQFAHDPTGALSQSEIRRRLYLKAMQSDRFTVLLGPEQKPFQVPQDLLIHHSSVFKKLSRSPSKESVERIVKLPKEKTPTFEDFFIWLHAFKPSLTLEPRDSSSMESIVDLAIFAEKYRICLLKNQTSDVIRTALSDNCWKVTPEIITSVYNSVPAGTILRQMFFLGFAIGCKNASWWRRTEGYTEWETVFCNRPDLGWDYFQHVLTGQIDSLGFGSGGACRYHDHSDIAGWVRGNGIKCPYPRGAPLDMLSVEESGTGEIEGESAEEDAVMEISVLEDPVEEEAVAGVATEDEVADEEAVDGEAVAAEATKDEVADEEAEVEEAVSGEALAGVATEDEVADEEAVEEEAVEEEAVDGEAVEEAIEGEAVEEEAVEDEVVDEEAVEKDVMAAEDAMTQN